MTAASKYQTTRHAITFQLERLNVALEAMDAEQIENQRDWSYAGNAAHVSAGLADLLDFVEDKPELFFEVAEL